MEMQAPVPADEDSKIIQEFKDTHKAGNIVGPLQLVIDLLLCVLAAGFSNAAEATSIAGVAFYAGAVALIGGRQRGLAEIVHQSSHRTVASCVWLNDGVGYVAAWLMGMSRSGYRAAHLLHHRATCVKGVDPDFKPVGPGFDVTLPQYTWRKLLNPPRYIWENRLYSAGERPAELVARSTFAAAMVYFSIGSGRGHLLFYYWVVPYFTTHVWFGVVAEQHEHAGLCNQPGPHAITRNRAMGFIPALFFAVHGEGYHRTHHAHPSMPNWHLAAFHELLMTTRGRQYALYRAQPSTVGFVPFLTDLLAPNPSIAHPVAPSA